MKAAALPLTTLHWTPVLQSGAFSLGETQALLLMPSRQDLQANAWTTRISVCCVAEAARCGRRDNLERMSMEM
ncbi:hypothetical protein PC116_g24763 [Phytophthora cactorum]|uniref:Uncharacterized protein n=1 Tax=Phytophthora cactorum TaxID=29920 RepID=A0A8T1DM08_9STRA|nr:hypothetical protein PC113_g6834 [Phytophthora cactorum]KAG2942235.1 hypothetical protein PC117_g9890 [Phytophthora cactorum]KAG4226832.1 hypothetical protein PC116_g24763 [Phytophthora cactorum]